MLTRNTKIKNIKYKHQVKQREEGYKNTGKNEERKIVLIKNKVKISESFSLQCHLIGNSRGET